MTDNFRFAKGIDKRRLAWGQKTMSMNGLCIARIKLLPVPLAPTTITQNETPFFVARLRDAY